VDAASAASAVAAFLHAVRDNRPAVAEEGTGISAWKLKRR
jgi:hypothetical protein